jgi:PIN domain nuclease of toxin-antitoxin system
MNCLMDTHILLWWFKDPNRIAKDIRSIIEDERNDVYYSPVSLWEISIKYGLGKLGMGAMTPRGFLEEVERSSFACLKLNNQTLASSYRLPARHGDPFDRMLVWQAIQSRMTLLSLDSSFADYVVDGLEVLPS